MKARQEIAAITAAIDGTFDGRTILKQATKQLGIHLGDLLAATSLWANPEVHRRLVDENGTGAYFPKMRRSRDGRRKRQIGKDDNTYANYAIKYAVGISRSKIVHFAACHVWPRTCYDARYYTTIANLVLIPMPLFSLSDHDPEIESLLQYHAYELYHWHPAECEAPQKPECYPTKWQKPMPFTSKVAQSLAKRKH